MAYKTPIEQYQSNAECRTITIQQDWMKNESEWEYLLNQMGITDEKLLKDGYDYCDIEEIDIKIDTIKISHSYAT